MYLYIYLVFLIFLYKKISGNSIPLTQKERCPKRYPNFSFLRDTTFKVSHSVEGHSRRLKQLKLLLYPYLKEKKRTESMSEKKKRNRK